MQQLVAQLVVQLGCRGCSSLHQAAQTRSEQGRGKNPCTSSVASGEPQELSPFKSCVVATGGGLPTRAVNWGHLQASEGAVGGAGVRRLQPKPGLPHA